jgi:hypothetical protein
MVIKEFEYVPGATNLKHKFRVLTCGVFLIKDVLRDIETAMGLDPGEGQEYVDSLISEVPGEHPRAPFIELALGDGIPVRLGSGELECPILASFIIQSILTHSQGARTSIPSGHCRTIQTGGDF